MPCIRSARPEDIGLLTRHFLNLAASEGLPSKQIDEDAISRLTQMQWRGNVRELKNFIYRLTLTAREDCISEATVMQIAGSGDAEPAMQGAYCSFEAAVGQFMAEQRQRGHGRERIYSRALAAFEKLKKTVSDLICSRPPLDAEDMKAAETIYGEVVETCRHLLRLCSLKNGKPGAFDLLN